MALDVGTLVANLKLDRSDFNKGVTESEGRFSGLGSKLGGAAKGIGLAVATGLAVAGTAAASGTVALYGTGVQIEALGKKAATVFGPELGKAQLWAAQNAEAMGLTRSQAVGLAAGFGDLLIPMGFTREAATKMSTDVIGLSGALSEWSGGQKSASDVADILAKAMLGETDGLKSLGISLSAAEVKAALAAKGQDKLTGAALQQAEALAIQGLILAKSTDAQAAYAAGADDPIRKQAQLRARALELKDAFATALLPASNAVVGGLLQMSEGALPKVEAGLAFVAGAGKQAFDVLFRGDFTGGPLSEDSATVDRLFRLRDGMLQTAGIAKQAYDVLFRGDFTGGPLSEDSQAVDVLFRIREGLGQVKAAVSEAFASRGESIDFAAALDKGATAAQNLWPQIVAAGESVRGLEPVVTVTGRVFGFMADNIDTIIAVMPLLLAAFVAYKTAQAAGNVVALASLPIQAATVVGNLAAASANRALATAITQQTAMQNANQVATARGTIATIAGTVASVAANVATKAMAAGQWLLNAALTANPIGLVVVAIAALTGGLIYAYKNSETFRNIVKGAFDAVAGAVRWVVDKMGDLFGLLSNVPGMGWAKDAADKMVGLGTATSGAGASVDNLKESEDAAKTATDNLNAATQTTLDKFTLLNEGALSAARAEDGWKASLDAVTESVRQNGSSLDNNTAAGRANRSAIEGAASALNEKVKSDVAAMIQAGDLAGATRLATDTFEANRAKLIGVAVQSGLNREAAERYANQLLATPAQIATAIQTPGLDAARREVQGLGVDINGLSDKTINIIANAKANGIIGWGVDKFGNIGEYAVGGAVHGPGTKTSDSVPALLSNGEHVWTAAEVATLGGHQAMYALRAAVLRGEIGAYAAGGAVGRTVTVRGSSQAAELDSAVRGAMGVAAAAVQTSASAAVARASAAAASASSGVAGRGNVDAELLRRFDSWNASIGGALRIVSGFRSSERQAQLYAAYRAGTGNLAARPGSSNHEKSPAQAIDYGPANWARTATSYLFGLKAPIRSEPWHLERAFDGGGVAYGTGMMPKFTSRPERVLSPEQTEAFDRLVTVLDRQGVGAGVSVSVSADAGLAQQYAEQVAERTVAKWRDALAVAGTS